MAVIAGPKYPFRGSFLLPAPYRDWPFHVLLFYLLGHYRHEAAAAWVVEVTDGAVVVSGWIVLAVLAITVRLLAGRIYTRAVLEPRARVEAKRALLLDRLRVATEKKDSAQAIQLQNEIDKLG